MKPDTFLKKIMFLTFFFILFYAGCDLFQKDEEPDPEEGFTETIFTNPDDAQIIQYDSAGRKVIYLGEKDSDGMPTKITQAIVDGEDLSEESRTLITFDDQSRTTSMSSEAYGYMTFEYISDTQVVVVYTLPDHMESYQLTFNPESASKVGDCGCPGIAREPGKISTIRPELNEPVFNLPRPTSNNNLVQVKSGQELTGNIYTFFNQTVNPVTGNKMLGMWEIPDGKTGALKITYEEPGKFNYYFPSNPAPPPPSGFTDKAKKLLTAVCLGSIPVTLAKEQICAFFTAGFVACEAILTAYVWLCRANTTYTIGKYTYDVYTADQVHVTVTSMHPNLPVKRGETDFNPSGSSLPEINIVYDAFAVIGNLYTSPADPDPDQGYTIYAEILNVIPGIDQVKLSMVGTDGYSKEQTFDLDATGICSMSIPGAEQGVRDDITAEVLNQYPQPGQTKTISIIF